MGRVFAGNGTAGGTSDQEGSRKVVKPAGCRQKGEQNSDEKRGQRPAHGRFRQSVFSSVCGNGSQSSGEMETECRFRRRQPDGVLSEANLSGLDNDGPAVGWNACLRDADFYGFFRNGQKGFRQGRCDAGREETDADEGKNRRKRGRKKKKGKERGKVPRFRLYRADGESFPVSVFWPVRSGSVSFSQTRSRAASVFRPAAAPDRPESRRAASSLPCREACSSH